MPRKRIAIPIIAQTIDGLLRDSDEIVGIQERDPDHEYIIEIRFDYAREDGNAFSRLVHHNPLKKIVTIRHMSEAGNDPNAGFKGDESKRRDLYQAAISAGADYIDFEHHHPLDLSLNGAKLIRSLHDFHKPIPAEHLLDYHNEVANEKPDIVKLALRSRSPYDSLNMLYLTESSVNTIAIPMGTEWHVLLARVLTLEHNGYLTFACLPGKNSASGQLTVDQLNKYLSAISETGYSRNLSMENFVGLGKKLGLA